MTMAPGQPHPDEGERGTTPAPPSPGPPPVELTVEAIGLTVDPHTPPSEVRLLIADELRPE
jgi:hypothetical protein